MEKVKVQCSKLLSANLRVTWGTREENFLQDNLRNIFYPQANSLFKIPGLEPSHESERLFSLNKLYTATTTPSGYTGRHCNNLSVDPHKWRQIQSFLLLLQGPDGTLVV